MYGEELYVIFEKQDHCYMTVYDKKTLSIVQQINIKHKITSPIIIVNDQYIVIADDRQLYVYRKIDNISLLFLYLLWIHYYKY